MLIGIKNCHTDTPGCPRDNQFHFLVQLEEGDHGCKQAGKRKCLFDEIRRGHHRREVNLTHGDIKRIVYPTQALDKFNGHDQKQQQQHHRHQGFGEMPGDIPEKGLADHATAPAIGKIRLDLKANSMNASWADWVNGAVSAVSGQQGLMRAGRSFCWPEKARKTNGIVKVTHPLIIKATIG